jgi:hypothetical protein
MLADLVLFIHFCIAGFITAGFVLIPFGAGPAGAGCGIAACASSMPARSFFVALESLAGFACPLTVWEAMLRGGRLRRNRLHRPLAGAGCFYWDFPRRHSPCCMSALALLAILALALGAASAEA